MPNPAMLIILDGWGHREEKEYNAIYHAHKPTWSRLVEKYPATLMDASSRAVGLPTGVMGNSEVGHLNLGAGRVIRQLVVRIDESIEDGSFFTNPALVAGIEKAKQNHRKVHLFGLVSDGQVHSSMPHLFAMFDLAKKCDFKDMFLHCFLDGRDTPPISGIKFVAETMRVMEQKGVGRVASVMGRYWAMDRDKRWDRVQRAYRAMVLGEAKKALDPLRAIQESYDQNINDEFLDPVIITETNGNPVALIEDGDTIIFFNFRSDRPREITRAFIFDDFKEFDRGKQPKVNYVCMTQYDETFPLPVAFPPETYPNLLGQVISERGYRQLRIAETEKYAHVTFFFNGGEEKVFKNESRILINSPKVPTYDLKPEMSCHEVAAAVVSEIDKSAHDLIVLNFANPDMVGHTGVWDAAVKAVENVDRALGKVLDALYRKNGVAIITADHGNAELMWDYENKRPHTAHTTNPVPLVLFNPNQPYKLRKGVLADIAPTILELMGESPVPEMSSKSLLISGMATPNCRGADAD